MSLLSFGATAVILASAARPPPLPFAYAIVVGSRSGGPGQNPLKYATEDAIRFGQLLVELGRYDGSHVHVLQDPTPEQLLGELRGIESALRERQALGEQTSLLFYYSGHARASGLSLGTAELPLADLRSVLTSSPADLTVAILDACQSGAFSRVKSAEAAPDFSINSVAQLNTRGLAVLASSTSSELSQESDRLAGSYFTHHLMMAMRGAGDLDGDGRVTLTEAYRYAYARTLVDTAATSVGSQHATLETNLRGKGEVSLTYPKEASATLSLASDLQGDILVSVGESIVGELSKTAGNPIRLGLPPAQYKLVVRQPEMLYECMADLLDGRETALALGSCTSTKLALGSNKGDVAGGVFESLSASRLPGWHFEMRADTPLSFYPGSQFVGSTEATFTYYFEKLRDDPQHPLGMLEFLQHPSSISVKPSLFFSSLGVGSYFGGTAAAVLYPWQQTGFTGSAAAFFTSPDSGLTLTLGIEHYFSSTLRVDATYFGIRTRYEYVSDNGQTQQSTTEDGGILGLRILWLHEKLFTQFWVRFSRVSQEGDFAVNGTELGANLSNEYFIGRNVSLGATLGLSRYPYPGSIVSASFGPLINAYVSDSLLLTASYGATFTSSHGLAGLGSSYYVVNLGVAWRL
jgi:hypothetical protein